MNSLYLFGNMVKIKNKHILKSKDLKILRREISEKLDDAIEFSKDKIETGRINDIELIFFNENPCFFRKNNQIFFSIKGLIKFNPTKN